MGHWGIFMDGKLIRAKLRLKNYLPKCSLFRNLIDLCSYSADSDAYVLTVLVNTPIFSYLFTDGFSELKLGIGQPWIAIDCILISLFQRPVPFFTNVSGGACFHARCVRIRDPWRTYGFHVVPGEFYGELWHSERLWILATSKLLKLTFSFPKSPSLTHGCGAQYRLVTSLWL